MTPHARSHAPNSGIERRNFRLGVANGVFTQLAMGGITDPNLVLSVFVRSLGGSNALVGALSAIRSSAWLLPQFLVASRIQPQEHKMPVSVALDMVRAGVYATLGILTYSLGVSNPSLLLAIFFALFSLSRLTAGAGALGRIDVIAKIVRPSRRAGFYATRNFWTGLVVFGAGFLVRFVLDEDKGLPFPASFTLLFCISAIGFLVAASLLARVREPASPSGMPRYSLRQQLARARGRMKGHPAFRRYVLLRIMLSITDLTAPFYPILALDLLDAPPSIVGLYMSAMTLSGILSNRLWERLGNHRGNVFLVRASALVTALVPLAAITLPWVMRGVGLTVQRSGLLPAYLFTLVFVASGSATSGRGIGLMALLLDIAPGAERASYVGFVRTALGIVSFLPIFAGAVIDRIGFEPVFGFATVLLLCGYLVTLGWERDGEL